MTTDKLKAMKAWCKAVARVPAHCKRCKWFTDLPDCLKEIERKNQALQEIITESGKVDINNWPAQQQICQAIAQEALGDE